MKTQLLFMFKNIIEKLLQTLFETTVFGFEELVNHHKSIHCIGLTVGATVDFLTALFPIWANMLQAEQRTCTMESDASWYTKFFYVGLN